MDSTHPSLLHRVRDRNDSMAWAEFHRLYCGLIENYAIARGLTPDDAADIAAECMRVLVTKMPEFDYDAKKGRFRAWLRRIAHNKVTDLLRKRRVQVAQIEQLQLLEDRNPGPDAVWEKTWEKTHLAHCLNKLKDDVPKQQFEAFRLYAIEEWDVERVTNQLDISANQVYLAKSRLTTKLKEIMKELLGEDASPQ